MSGGMKNPEAKNEIVVYQPNETVRLEVRVGADTVWLNRQQLAQLFGRDVKTIGKHIANALQEELSPVVSDFATTRSAKRDPTVAKFATVQKEGSREVVRQVEYYNLEMITSVGYRVKSPQGVLFRRWANQVLKEYLLRGFAVNARLNQLEDKIDRRLAKHDADIVELKDKVDFFVRTSQPPVQGVFYDGQYGGLTVKTSTRFHDRFLVIDDKRLYLVGASLKDLGRKCFAFTQLDASEISGLKARI